MFVHEGLVAGAKQLAEGQRLHAIAEKELTTAATERCVAEAASLQVGHQSKASRSAAYLVMPRESSVVCAQVMEGRKEFELARLSVAKERRALDAEKVSSRSLGPQLCHSVVCSILSLSPECLSALRFPYHAQRKLCSFSSCSLPRVVSARAFTLPHHRIWEYIPSTAPACLGPARSLAWHRPVRLLRPCNWAMDALQIVRN